MKNQPEFQLQVLIADYLRSQYPRVLFVSSMAGMKLSMPQAVRNKRIQKDDFCCPDLMILEKRGEFGALFLELKKESPFKKNGELKTDEHLQKQSKSLECLWQKGYWAIFAWTFEDAKNAIDNYLKK